MTPEHTCEPLPIDTAEPADLPPTSAASITPATSFPELLTEAEAVRYLRLDTIRGLRNPGETLARYRAMGLLRGTQVSKSVFYRRIELDRFLDRLTNENPR
ncbi:MAG: hypothetical protein HOP29_11250 [Phycisphaerales bacterium]|nr:hypothetical protein [Phycisphaerales bacterium]